MAAFTSPHSSPYGRLVANVIEDRGCWIGTEKTRGRGGYVQVNFRVRGLGGRIVKFSAHVLSWIAQETGYTDIDDLFLAYHEFRCSGLELDHTCVEPACRCPWHLEPVTHAENIRRAHGRRSATTAMPDPCEVPF